MNKTNLSGILIKELCTDNKTAHRVAGILWTEVCTHVREQKRLDRVKEREKAKKEGKEEAVKKPVGLEIGNIDTLEGFFELLKSHASGGNAQIMKLYSELKGFEKATQDLNIEIISYKEAPEAYFVSKPPEGVVDVSTDVTA